jgi:hypothetical protein
MLTLRCPLCFSDQTNIVLNDFEICVKHDGPTEHVSGLTAFQCSEAHVFFVTCKDLLTPIGAAADPDMVAS